MWPVTSRCGISDAALRLARSEDSPRSGRWRQAAWHFVASTIVVMWAGASSLAGARDVAGTKAENALPQLLFQPGPGMENYVARLGNLELERLANALQLVGLESGGDPIRIVIAGESSQTARNTPRWIAGYAYGVSGVVVLFPARTPGYPDNSLEELLLHEVSHVLTARASEGREVPRWFNEGLALFIGRPWGLDDRSYMSLAMLTRAEPTLAELETRFLGTSRDIRLAYAVSGALVRDLVRRHGRFLPGKILATVALGASFEEAYLRASGESLDHATASFWRRHSFWYRWVPILTSSVTLWIGITFLALVAIRKRRKKDAALYDQWQMEERLQEAESLRRLEPPVN